MTSLRPRAGEIFLLLNMEMSKCSCLRSFISHQGPFNDFTQHSPLPSTFLNLGTIAYFIRDQPASGNAIKHSRTLLQPPLKKTIVLLVYISFFIEASHGYQRRPDTAPAIITKQHIYLGRDDISVLLPRINSEIDRKDKILLPPTIPPRTRASSSKEKVQVEPTSKDHLAFMIDLKSFDDGMGSLPRDERVYLRTRGTPPTAGEIPTEEEVQSASQAQSETQEVVNGGIAIWVGWLVLGNEVAVDEASNAVNKGQRKRPASAKGKGKQVAESFPAQKTAARSVEEMNDVNFTAENRIRAWKVCYFVGRSGKESSPLTLVNPDENGVCEVVHVPNGKRRVVFFPQYRKDNERSATARNKWTDLVPEASYIAELTRLNAKIAIAGPGNDVASHLNELFNLIRQLDVEDSQANSSNSALTKMISGQILSPEEAQKTAEQCLLLWPQLNEFDNSAIIDEVFFEKMSYACRVLKDTFRVPYKHLYMLVSLMVMKSNAADYGTMAVTDFAETVKKTYHEGLLVFNEHPKQQSAPLNGDSDAVLLYVATNIKEHLQQQKKGTETLKGLAAASYGWKHLPPMMSFTEAILMLPEGIAGHLAENLPPTERLEEVVNMVEGFIISLL
ncbi:hypothetical protein CSAL01_08434 [Colletotrichum salicis]|uniref:Uncharacterized protein n=1 Tax=Colletotrichum salicis TaxID=1209931 RepID=A0A135U6Y6_9PEZI|nr:hypothetical protein CSAL01_08434 [Colletotrichum salicis]